MAIKLLRRLSKHHSRVQLYEMLEDAVLQYVANNNARILNVGAGGDIARHLEHRGVNTVSIDVDPARHPDLVMDVQDMSAIDEASVDAVIMCEVLEHVQDPASAVREIQRVLTSRGVLIGSTPFILGLHDEPHDYYRFTKFGLRFLFRQMDEVLLRERNTYFAAATVLCLRVFNVGTEQQLRKAVWLSPLVLFGALWMRLLSSLLSRTDATTGYFFVFRKAEK